MASVMTVVNTNKYQKIIKAGLNFLVPSILLIYFISSLMTLSLFSAELGNDAIRYNIMIFSSIGITSLITGLFYLSRVYPKFSIKKRISVFTISLLTLTDSIIWWDLRIIEILIEGIGSISVDLTPLFLGLLILLSCNLFLKGLNLFTSHKIKENITIL